ncbi:MAG: prepilin-type N-terminal cleavage/methylation domain-containing protein [Candidatus Shapirobacteria bacterium]
MTYSKAFSLVELLVVISIIAIISAFTLPNFMGARERARDSSRISDMSAIKNSLRMYYNDHQSYPLQIGGTLGVDMVSYMPSILNLGYTYEYFSQNNGDGFLLKLKLDSGQGDDDIESQTKCGVGVTDGYYAVCAN